jgi:hypothetical protein
MWSPVEVSLDALGVREPHRGFDPQDHRAGERLDVFVALELHEGVGGLMLFAFIATIVFGLEIGVLAAVAASIAVLVYRVSNPRVPELGREPG